jgi:hypothetical protein
MNGIKYKYYFDNPIHRNEWYVITKALELRHPGIRWGSDHKLEDWFSDGMVLLGVYNINGATFLMKESTLGALGRYRKTKGNVVIDGNTLLDPLIDTHDAFDQINESKNGNGDLYYFSKPITQEDWSLILNFLKAKYPDIKWFSGDELENYIKYPSTIVLYISPYNKLSVGFGGIDYMNEPRYNGWGKYNGDEIFDIIDTHDAFNQINESVEGEQIIYRFETPITEDSWPIKIGRASCRERV